MRIKLIKTILTAGLFVVSSMSSMIAAQNRTSITIDGGLAPGKIKVRISSSEAIELTTRKQSGGELTFYIARIKLVRSVTKNFEDIPFVSSVTVEELTPRGGKITIQTDRSTQFEFTQSEDRKTLEVFFNGDMVAEELYLSAENKRKSGDISGALVNYRDAVRLRGGNFPEAYFGIGLIRESLGQPKLAIGSFKRTLQDTALRAETHRHLASLLEAIGKPELAKEHLAMAQGSLPEGSGSDSGRDSLSVTDSTTGELQIRAAETAGESGKKSGDGGFNIMEYLPRTNNLSVALLVLVLLLPFAVLFYYQKKSKKRTAGDSAAGISHEEFTKQLEGAVREINEEVEELQIEEPAQAAKKVVVEASGSRTLLKTISPENRHQVQNRVERIISLKDKNLSPKEIAQEVGISENEVRLTLEIGKQGLELMKGKPSAYKKAAGDEKEIKEIAKDMHRDEEQVKMEILASENLD